MSGCKIPVDQAYTTSLRIVLSREYVRNWGSVEAFDKDYEQGTLVLGPYLVGYADQLISACRYGGVVPGLYFDADTTRCVQDWVQFACFSNWYSKLGDEQRAIVLKELRSGNAPTFMLCDTPDSACCRSEIYQDELYTGMPDGNASGKAGILLGLSAAVASIFGLLWLLKGRS